ncbi:serine hydrolase domain-containing protein [Tsuneonella sp. SYSU-LHT278]|uniref:serine hydrolase domain-containing protein n=1 Tax=Tsuneonella sediminis TaxID=3416089 RepID=UPI003F799FC4
MLALALGTPAPDVRASPASPAADRAGDFATDHPAGAPARAFLELLTGSEPIAPRLGGIFSKAALERLGSEAVVHDLETMRRQSGGFDLVSIAFPGERMAEIRLRSVAGSRHGKLVLFLARDEPGRVSQYFFLADRDPERAAADAFPRQKVDRDTLRRLVVNRLDALAQEGHFSGALLVAQGDEIVLREARGFADAVWGITNTPDTRFNIASIGKMFTAVVILRLAEQGVLTLDDTVGRWVPEYPHKDAAQRMTLRSLLNHTAGVGAWDGRMLRSAARPNEKAASMTAQPNPSGGRVSYSNAGYVLLGAAAEAATGKSFEQLVDELVFRPAGMGRSGYWPVTAVITDRATGYRLPESDPLGFNGRMSNEQFLGYAGDPSGGAYATVDDMMAFHRALADGTLLSAASRAAMIADPVPFPGAPRPWTYGLGMRLEDCAGVPTLGHSGGGANSGVSASTHASLDGSWTIIVLGNVDPMPEELAMDICELVHQQ